MNTIQTEFTDTSWVELAVGVRGYKARRGF